MILKISDRAKKDLLEIWLCIARDDELAASNFIDKIYCVCETIKSQPEMGRLRPELLPRLRSYPIKRYVIYYRVSKDTVEIIRILSGYRDLASIF